MVPGQRLGRECFAATKREYHRRAALAGPQTTPQPGEATHAPPAVTRKDSGAAGNAGNTPSAADHARVTPDPPPAFVPFIEGPPEHLQAWYAPFLEHLSVNGGLELAAAAAGVTGSTVRWHRKRYPAFADEADAALAFYRERIEWESVNLARTRNNPLPYFARLKAELPSRYIDRSAILAVTADTGSLTAAEATALLRSMLGAATPATRHLLSAGEPPVEPTE